MEDREKQELFGLLREIASLLRELKMVIVMK